MMGRSRAIFRETALRRHAAGSARDEALRDVSPRLLGVLWSCAGLLGCGLLVLAGFVASLLR